MKYYVNKLWATFDFILLFPSVNYGKFASTRGYFPQKTSARLRAAQWEEKLWKLKFVFS